MKLAATMRPDQHLLVNLSGRGDKDIGTVADLSGAGILLPTVVPRAKRQGWRADRGGEAMSRISGVLNALKAQGRKALIPLHHCGRPLP